MTQANIIFYTGVASKPTRKYLDAMLKEGLLEFDSTDEGDVVYVVRGSSRAVQGSTQLVTCFRCTRATPLQTRCGRCGQVLNESFFSQATQKLAKSSTALQLFRPLKQDLLQQKPGNKNVLTGAALGLLGPLGWLYSGAWRETVPATIIWSVLISFSLIKWSVLLLAPILLPLSAIVGGLYAFHYNRTGQRQSLVLDGLEEKTPFGRRK